MESYRTIIEPGEVLNIEKKSKFLGFVFPCDSIEEFEEELSRIKQEHHGASHHCYAYRIKENIVMERYNDDREPSQTAGLPILDVLKGQELLQCAIIVVRYYGGTKLGTGGLTRAYSAAARDAVASTDIAVKEEAAIVKVTVGYGMSGKVEYHINAEEVPLIDTVYEQNVGLRHRTEE